MEFNKALKLCKNFQGLSHHKDIYLCGSLALHLGGRLYKDDFKDVDFIIHKDKFLEYLFHEQGRTVQSDLLTHDIQSDNIKIPNMPYVHFNIIFNGIKCCLFVVDFHLQTEMVDGIRCQKLDDVQHFKFIMDKHKKDRKQKKYKLIHLHPIPDNFDLDDIPF